MHAIRIDRSKPLGAEPEFGHNRYCAGLDPVLAVAPGEEVLMETRDAFDGQITPTTTAADLAHLDVNLLHPMTGPVYVKGAKPGDVLEVEFLDIIPQPRGYSIILPGLGFLRDTITGPFCVHWQLKDGWATTAEIPGVRIPGAPFMGISAVSPSEQKLEEWAEREQRSLERGDLVFPPEPTGSVPHGSCGLRGLRTCPPRENGGNADVKQLTKGSKLFLPVFEEGAMFSTGDAHFAQGDGEVCVTAVEMSASVLVRFKVHEGLAARRKVTAPVFTQQRFFTDPKYAVPERFTGVMGFPINNNGDIEGENLTLACRNAVLNMIELLMERGLSREQAYVIVSVAVDLHISQVVDVPNVVVSAILPEIIFGGD